MFDILPGEKVAALPEDLTRLKPLVVADFLRPAPNSTAASVGMQNRLINRLATWLSGSLRDVFSQPLEIGVWDESLEESFPSRDVYEAENLDPSTLGWTRLYHRSPNTNVIEILRPFLRGRLAIGFELSPYQEKVCDALGVPYISLAIHPLRFMKDYAFTISSNFLTSGEISSFRISKSDIAFSAHMKFAGVAAASRIRLKENSAILFGQVDIDASLINPMGYCDALWDYSRKINEIFREFGTVYFKPHPYQDATQQLQYLGQFGNIEILTSNPYVLLAAPEITTVAAITSSVLSESKFFGKEPLPLAPFWQDKSNEPAYGLVILSPHFWSFVTSLATEQKNPTLPGIASEVTLKSLLQISWDEFGRNPIEPSGELVPIGPTIPFGLGQKADAFCRGETWMTAAEGHRWMTAGETHLSFRVPSRNQKSYCVDLRLSAMASAAEPIKFKVICCGSILSQKLFTSLEADVVSFHLPAEMISPVGDVVLNFACDTSNWPQLICGVPDHRPLSAAAHSITITPTESAQFLEVGETLRAERLYDSSPLLSSGWHHPEPSGIWSAGRNSRISITTAGLPDGDLELTLGNASAFLTHILEFNTMIVSVDDQVCLNHKFAPTADHVNIVVPLPRRFFQNKGNIVNIDIHLIGCHSPKDAGVSTDCRELGVRIEYFKLDSAVRSVASRPSEHIANVVGPFNIRTGLATMARNTVLALDAAIHDSPLDTAEFRGPKPVNFNTSFHLDEDLGFFRGSTMGSDINVFVGDVTHAARMVHANGKDFLNDRYNVVYGAWELDQMPTYLTDTRYIQEYWGLSTFIADAARKRMDVPVYAFPIPVNLHYPQIPVSRDRFLIPENTFVFLFTFGADSTMARKNPAGVLDAFQIAFPDENVAVTLVIKTMPHQASLEEQVGFEELKLQASKDKRVVVIEEALSQDENSSLYLMSDAYISLHRAEGFGLSMAEAMGYGKPTIATGYSGNLDFMTIENSCLVDFDMVDMQPGADHSQTQLWAEPNVVHAADLMRRVQSDIAFRESIASEGKRTIHQDFSPCAVGKKLLARLAEIRKHRAQ